MATTNTTTEQLQEWTPEADANWKNPDWWTQGTPEEHCAMDALFSRHINEDFRQNKWEEPKMGQEVYFVSTAGGLLKRIIRGYDYNDDVYFLINPENGNEVKIDCNRIWGSPADALIYQLRRTIVQLMDWDDSDIRERDRRRQKLRRMLRFMMAQLETL